MRWNRSAVVAEVAPGHLRVPPATSPYKVGRGSVKHAFISETSTQPLGDLGNWIAPPCSGKADNTRGGSVSCQDKCTINPDTESFRYYYQYDYLQLELYHVCKKYRVLRFTQEKESFTTKFKQTRASGTMLLSD